MRFRNRYSCIYIFREKVNKPIYFELSLIDKDLNRIISQINKEFNIDFKINKSYIDENYGILLIDNYIYENSNMLYICHCANLEKVINKNNYLKNKNNLEQMIYLFMEFIKFKNIN